MWNALLIYQIYTFVDKLIYSICLLVQIMDNTWALFPGVIGLSVLFRSQIKISDSLAPDATKFFCNNDKWSYFKHSLFIYLLSAVPSNTVRLVKK